MYYLRTQAATQAVQFTVEKQADIPANIDPEPAEGAVCTMQDGCISCGS
jgi:hypothetical protein